MQVKVCGITNIEDALAAVEFGADALGFIFYERSPRAISVERASRIIKSLPREVVKVAVLVNQSVDQAAELLNEIEIDMIQLHSGQSPNQYRIADQKIIQVFAGNVHSDFCGDFALIDNALATEKVNQSDLNVKGPCKLRHLNLAKQFDHRKLILSGGLSSQNVAATIRKYRPAAVDVCSAIESQFGVKDHHRMKDFIESANQEFANIKRSQQQRTFASSDNSRSVGAVAGGRNKQGIVL